MWEGPAAEARPEPSSTAGFIPTARGRVKPADLDADGHFGLAAIVHRLTDACLQGAAAIGMDAAFLEANHRGFSTFELALRISGASGSAKTAAAATVIIKKAGRRNMTVATTAPNHPPSRHPR